MIRRYLCVLILPVLSACTDSTPTPPAAPPAVANDASPDVPAPPPVAPAPPEAPAGDATDQVTPAGDAGETLVDAVRGDERLVLTADDRVFDWGTAFQGQVFEHTFKVKNTSRSEIFVREIKAECGCTVTADEIKDRKLAPGEVLEIPMRIDTTEFKTYTKKDLDIICDGEVAGDTKLQMQGDVKQLLLVEPEMPRFEIVRDEKLLAAASMDVELVSNLDRPVEVSSVAAEKNLVAVELQETEKGVAWKLTLRPKLDAKQKIVLHNEILRLTTRVDGREIKIGIPLSVKLEDRIQILPSRSLWFSKKMTKSLSDPDAPLPTKTLEIKSAGTAEHRFKVTGVEVERDAYTTALETVEEGRHYRLQVTLERPESKRPIVKATLWVKTDDPEFPRIKIPGTAQF